MTTAADIMATAGRLLNDEEHIRWTPPELREWINDGLKAVLLAKPSAKTATRVLSLSAGTLQSLPTDAGAPTPLALIDITRNIKFSGPNVPGRVVTIISRAALDAAEPNWHDVSVVAAKKECRHYCYDEQNPLEFFVYPANDGSGMVEAVISQLPTLVADHGGSTTATEYSDVIDLALTYDPVLVDYVCYRAHMKDATASEPGMANDFYGKFANALGIKIQVEGGSSPNNRRGKP